jgi:hypothetical protein
MTTAETHPRRARNKRLALFFLTFIAMLSSAGMATAQPSRGASRSSQVLRTAASASAAERTLIADARALRSCRSISSDRCRAVRRAVQRTGHRLALSERHLSKLAGSGRISRATTYSAALRAPRLSVSGQTLYWNRPGGVDTFVLVSKVAGEEDHYSVIKGTSTTPPPVPGYTVRYSIRTNVNGSAWASERSISYPVLGPANGVSANATPAEEVAVSAGTPATEPLAATAPSAPTSESGSPAIDPQSAPIISVSGQTLTWPQIGDVNTYVFVRKVPGQEARYSTVAGTSITPSAEPGATVSYSVRTAVPGSAWAPEVAVSYPSSPAGESTPGSGLPVAPLPASKIIGTNDGAGWGSAAARTILGGHITWNRVEIGMESNTLAESVSDGFHNLAIVGNIEDGTPLSQVDPSSWGAMVVSQIQDNPGIAIAEAGNEMYLKGGVANPTRYGQMYLAAVEDMRAAGIDTPLLFDMLGDYATGSWSSPSGYSRDAQGGGWLHDAVATVPGLAAAIRENGLSTHPYGELGENDDDTNGVNAVAAQEAIAQSVLGAIPPLYITEFGYSLSNCGESDGACSQPEQATKMRAAYAVLLADPHVAGIWWYQSHDDSTGHFGYMNSNNTTRPSFETLSSIAIQAGQ